MLNKIVFLNCIYEAVQNKNLICLALLLICFSVFLRLIIEKEGLRSLFRGLGPNLIGVAPSRWVFVTWTFTEVSESNAVRLMQSLLNR